MALCDAGLEGGLVQCLHPLASRAAISPENHFALMLNNTLSSESDLASAQATPPSAPLIAVEHVFKTGSDSTGELTILRDIDFTLAPQETVAIVGASGSGKSTLLHLLGGLDAPSRGRVQLMGRELVSLSPAEQGRMRNQHLGFVYQFHHLLPEFSAAENVAMPLFIRRDPKAQALQAASAMLSAVGLGQRLQHRPSELSGGERQRVALARALVTRPACVLADEPTGNLDRSTAEGVFELMLKLAREQGTAFVVVTHDQALAVRCSRQLRLVGGRLSPGLQA
jgi:lipoprotein-releasing system ATP-binding protein